MWVRSPYAAISAGIIFVLAGLFLLIPAESAADGSASPQGGAVQQVSHPATDSLVSFPNSPPRPPQVAVKSAIASPQRGLPSGQWERETPIGRIELSVSGSKITMRMDGAGELEQFEPTLRGEYSVASDGTIYGLIHNVDLGLPPTAAEELGDELVLLSGLSDLPFTMRTYSEPDVLAIKQVTFGLPMTVIMAAGGEQVELSVYVQSMLAGQFTPLD